jgi:phage terminase small subunit
MESNKSPKNLTIKQENFCQAYIETGNASEAYRRAYSCEKMKDSVINIKACELLKNGKVTVRVRELQGELRKSSDIKKTAILEELSCLVFSDIRDYVTFDGTTLKFKSFDDLTDKQARAIESIKKSKTGIEIKLHGKSWSIERVCKMLGYDAPKDLNLNFERLPEEQLDQIINELTKKVGNG